ncbi:MAG TPA: phosphoribosylformylglycinamidine synthase subunit PurS [Candidatus Hydrothermia bacterium]|nr:phosphoribosylformylglycinamidine synthase subunit PurS [Candidatus Hydrothermae bacterium]MDD3648631.1 phosphoribosylformylglycinamidine synthase subunit PurS [Candidatus Hydrothermia bacterium]MDD5573337.1 phosphoribosylformylglycinamidine synthase subunit PurS [Candidatus Hydrothermia bacterium]HOK22509.1 phosphoribosylformylglycinamidine synthase subunit PurS [Candidatus Hydrothermia bacterium]HOL23216.1 phosphoribosylformylglycinamidine synthase subunit PurS [Candidatus Hydrothermia bac
MAKYRVSVIVRMREDLPEPQGIALEKVLKRMGYKEISDIRVGKILEMNVEGDNKEKVVETITNLSNDLFSNPVIENFELKVMEL